MFTIMKPKTPGTFVSSSIPLWILFAGQLFAALFLRNLESGIEQIDDHQLRALATVLNGVHHFASHWLIPLFLLLVLFIQIRIFLRKPVQLGLDLLGIFLSLRCLILFLILNVLLLSHLKSGGMLLMQLVCFIPVITIDFGWIYWRLDTAARRQGRSHIRFTEDVGTLDTFDYFYVAAMTLLQFEPSGAAPTSRLMKFRFVLHGIMMLDLVALTLSRAIALATGG